MSVRWGEMGGGRVNAYGFPLPAALNAKKHELRECERGSGRVGEWSRVSVVVSVSGLAGRRVPAGFQPRVPMPTPTLTS